MITRCLAPQTASAEHWMQVAGLRHIATQALSTIFQEANDSLVQLAERPLETDTCVNPNCVKRL